MWKYSCCLGSERQWQEVQVSILVTETGLLCLTGQQSKGGSWAGVPSQSEFRSLQCEASGSSCDWGGIKWAILQMCEEQKICDIPSPRAGLQPGPKSPHLQGSCCFWFAVWCQAELNILCFPCFWWAVCAVFCQQVGPCGGDLCGRCDRAPGAGLAQPEPAECGAHRVCLLPAAREV